ncbi:MAG: hypothetical protein Q8S31_08010 [Alphaproteobacteria bacterium]|jgi:hypothetical protein|nr:hypothetical protein [Alphaproteobacteria bacterium]
MKTLFLSLLVLVSVNAYAAPPQPTKSNNLPTYEGLKKGVPEKKLNYQECLKRGGVIIMNPQHHERGTCVKKEGAPLHKMM